MVRVGLVMLSALAVARRAVVGAAPAASAPDAQHQPEETDAEPEAEPDAEEDDYVDEDEEVREAAARAAKAAAARKAAELLAKAKKVTAGLAAPTADPRKLIIKEGVIHGEVVAAKTFTLRRVEKVRGDKDLTALRAAAAAQSSSQQLGRKSAIGGVGFAPRASSARILTGLAPHSDRPISERETLGVATPYSFTTVARIKTVAASAAMRARSKGDGGDNAAEAGGADASAAV